MPLPQSFPARCALAILSGGLYSLAYPPLGWGWIVFPGVIGLLLSLRDQSGTSARTIGFLHGMTAYAISLSWLYNIFGGMVVMLWCVLAAFTALFAEMQSRATLRGITGWKFAIFTALNWSALEFIRAELFPLKFPWMTAGLAIGPNALLSWIGVYGVSTLVILSATFLVLKKWKPAAALLIVLTASVALLRSVPSPSPSDPNYVNVGGIQLENVSLTKYLEGTKKLPTNVQYVVWPEYAVPYDLRANKRDMDLVQELSRQRNITLTLGTQSRPGGGDTWRNIALTLDHSGILGEHTKVHPVHFFDDGIPGTTLLPIDTRHGKVGTPICFDTDYEGVFRKMTTAGAEFFVVPTMDAGNWSARQHDQHAELFRIRACENGRWVFAVATSGVSQIIDPNGQVQTRLAALEQGTITGTLNRETKLTFYTRYGWLTPWCTLTAAIIWWFILILPRKRKIM